MFKNSQLRAKFNESVEKFFNINLNLSEDEKFLIKKHAHGKMHNNPSVLGLIASKLNLSTAEVIDSNEKGAILVVDDDVFQVDENEGSELLASVILQSSDLKNKVFLISTPDMSDEEVEYRLQTFEAKTGKGIRYILDNLEENNSSSESY